MRIGAGTGGGTGLDGGGPFPRRHRIGQRPRSAWRHNAADGDPLVEQSGHRDLPAGADLAEPVGVRHPHVGEVHLVEVGVAVHLP